MIIINSVEKHYLPDENDVYIFQNIYKVTYSNDVVSFVPHNEANTDYQAIQEWAKIEGNNIIDPGA